MFTTQIDSSLVFKILIGWIVVGIAIIFAASSGIVFPRWVPFLLLAGSVLLAITGFAYYQNETNGAALSAPRLIGWALFIGLVFWLSRLV